MTFESSSSPQYRDYEHQALEYEDGSNNPVHFLGALTLKGTVARATWNAGLVWFPHHCRSMCLPRAPPGNEIAREIRVRAMTPAVTLILYIA